MLSLFIWGSSDPYSHKLHFIRSMIEGDYSNADIKSVVEQNKSLFKQGRMSALNLMLIDVDMTTNTVTVVENIAATNPLKKKNIVNPEVLKIREKRNQDHLERKKRLVSSLANLSQPSLNSAAQAVWGSTQINPAPMTATQAQEFFFSESEGPAA